MQTLAIVVSLIGFFGVVGGLILLLIAIFRGKGKKRPITVLIASFSVFVIGIIIGLSTLEEKTDVQQLALEAQKTPELTEKAYTRESQKVTQQKRRTRPGNGISRSKIITVFEQPTLGFTFSKGVPIGGEDNYSGMSSTATIQLIGPEDDLSEASIAIVLVLDIPDDLVPVITLVAFAKIIDNNSVDWVLEQFEIALQNMDRPYCGSKIFGPRNYEISYHPAEYSNVLSLTITPATGK